MRPNKYDVTTAYGLCQDYLPPDGGDFGCIMYSTRLCNNVTVCTQQSHIPSSRRKSFCHRHSNDTKYNDSRHNRLLVHASVQNNAVRKRDTNVSLFQQQLETCWNEKTTRNLLLQRVHCTRLFRISIGSRSKPTCRFHTPR